MTRRALARKLSGGGLAAAVAIGAVPMTTSAKTTFTSKVALERATAFLKLMNGGKISDLKQYIAPTCAFHWPWPVPGTGPDYAVSVVNVTRSIFPDLVATPVQFQVAGDWVTVVATLAGTHSGAFLGVPPTGKKVSFQSMFFGRVDKNLQIAELWMESDFIAAAIQITGASDLVKAFLGGLVAPASPVAAPSTTLDAVLAVPGVVLALDYSPDGKVLNVKGTLTLPQAEIDETAAFAPPLMAGLELLSERHNDVSKLTWTPVKWALYSGGDKWTVALAGSRVVYAETAKVDFNALYGALVGPRP
jgi:roadblock/LC7 domain-containing protein